LDSVRLLDFSFLYFFDLDGHMLFVIVELELALVFQLFEKAARLPGIAFISQAVVHKAYLLCPLYQPVENVCGYGILVFEYRETKYPTEAIRNEGIGRGVFW